MYSHGKLITANYTCKLLSGGITGSLADKVKYFVQLRTTLLWMSGTRDPINSGHGSLYAATFIMRTNHRDSVGVVMARARIAVTRAKSGG